MNQRTQNQDDSTQPESAPGPATVHVLYLDTAGTEQRITIAFTDQAMASDPQRLEALQACMAQGVAKAGGVLLAMQLEMSADSVLLEPPRPRAEPAPEAARRPDVGRGGAGCLYGAEP
jgi:hypothetical protein